MQPTKPPQETTATGAAAGGQIERQIGRLARDVQELRVEFQRFLSGDRGVPPEELRTRIRGELGRLRNVNLKSAADRFRLGAIEAQFNSYDEMFGRRLRQLEEGRGPHPRPSLGERPGYDVGQGVLISDSPPRGAVEALFGGLAERGARTTHFDLESFRAYLQRQVGEIRRKTGCQAVQFRLVSEGGKVKIKARPMMATSDPGG
ncbi:MAG TPA: MXAN_5187 C-terminal domain-containing protein [Thermoanaerobaculia bacterium]|nr:MXAN_5187 C-terminal domain-containing protein [Thermoanaerobaculia bacterium]